MRFSVVAEGHSRTAVGKAALPDRGVALETAIQQDSLFRL